MLGIFIQSHGKNLNGQFKPCMNKVVQDINMELNKLLI